jgi:hypothetical protein
MSLTNLFTKIGLNKFINYTKAIFNPLRKCLVKKLTQSEFKSSFSKSAKGGVTKSLTFA